MCVCVSGDCRRVRHGAAVAADALRGLTRRASRVGVVHRSQRHDRRMSGRPCTVLRRTHACLLQHLLLVPRRLHPLRAVLSSRPA